MTAPDDDKVNILLVDDRPDRLLSYEAVLADLGQNLVKASSGVEALERLMKDDFAVILLDVSMPEMDGFETAALIHQHPRFERTPIIFVTALHVTDLDRLKGYELGAVDYVYVPVVPAILRSKVCVFVELCVKRRELQRLNETLERANAELAAANSTLQAEKTRELESLNQTLAAANAQLEHANRTLKAEAAERERLEQVLRAADRRKDEFLAMLAHELRNPLAPLRNALVSLQRLSLSEQDRAQALAMMSRQITQMARLIDELIDISRITSDRIELRMEPTDLRTIIEDACEIARPAIEQRDHRLSIEAPLSPLLINVDRTRIAQVLSNILHNAAKYTEPNGAISLSAAVEDEGIVIRVRDTGIGIAPGMLGKIFDMFVQVDPSFERSQGGLGIGLTLAKRLAELHGGTVTAHSAGVGEGSEFAVCLPPGLIAVEEGARSQSHADDDGARCCIVIADDNADYAESTAFILRAQGHSVHVAYDGLQALALVESQRPDVLLLDIGLPKLNGYDVARRVRALETGRGLLLVAITGWGQERDRELANEAGFDQHLVKPVDPEALMKIIARRPCASAPDGAASSSRSPAADPAVAAETRRTTPVASTRETRTDGGDVTRRRVLVVDDNEDVRTSVSDMLRDAGYEVEAAPDGTAAVDLAERWRPHCVLVDLNMPIVNGYELARQLRARHSPAQMKLVMMSGMALNAAVHDSAKRAGFDDAIDKMAKPEQWVQILQLG